MASSLWVFIVVGCLTLSARAQQWQLVWEDTFDQGYLDPNKWDYEVDCWGGGNNEKQCYVNHQENVYVQNGVLHLNAIHHPGGYTGSPENCTNNNENSCTWTQPCTSGRIRTLKAVDGSWLYGRFEISAKMPRGDFLWPALWFLPTDWVYGTWAASGEIDLLEFRGQDRHDAEHTLHFGGEWPYNTYDGSHMITHPFDLTDQFHLYAMEWERDEMRWYVDGALMHRMNLDRSFYSGSGPNPYTANRQPFDQRFHMIINLAVAGNYFDPNRYGYFDEWYHPTTWTQPFQVDSVRVFRAL
eukprot:NODE_949_length_1101_cov_100.320329_g905_i0.p1 GENE.NODE_949_length_1101_cov_100.320329_g905_i0~~NODE_949_length_1101_cov_100.320329_g905_i0.p1  ORF type:complete len:298 (-),score=32.78 NODE_949_length_1101_cov_100.320329_g905_i0:96-989(-)